MFNIDSFKSNIQKWDVQRPNLFHVKVNLPANLKYGRNDTPLTDKINAVTDNGRMISAFCRTATLPGAAFGMAETRRYGLGPTVRTPVFSSSSPDVSLTFLSDSYGILRIVFTNWMRCIYQWDPNESVGDGKNYQLGYKKDYSSDLEIDVYHGEPGKYKGSGVIQALTSVAAAKAGVPFLGSLINGNIPSFDLKKTRFVKLYKAFPISISEMSLSQESTNTLSEFTVNFSYYEWFEQLD